jgi:hypothetical protein
MLNPGGTSKQGYDDGLSSYDETLNAGLINGKPVAADTPLEIQPGSSLVSAVSWLWKSQTESEPGTPRFGGGAGTPRPAIRSAGVLSVLDKPAPEGSFRPPYSGTDRSVKFNISQLDYTKLPNLPAVANTPALEKLQDQMAKPWIDHVNGWMGAMLHPSEHMPNYGRDLGNVVVNCTLALFTGNEKPGENPAKDKVLINLVQFGIDCSGIADAGGSWPADGGHGLGRKWPILFAGAMLNDKHMLDIGQRKTRFQEDDQTFYVDQAAVDMTASPKWAPDKRAPAVPYTKEDIGMAEWGIRHATKPEADNKDWGATYREINGAIFPGYALAARLMNLQKQWNHDAFFDYCDRYMKWYRTEKPKLSNNPSPFLIAMWEAHRGEK